MSEFKKVGTKLKAGEQLPLVFGHTAATGRDDLLVSERLAAAVAIIDSWPSWPSPGRDPCGSGRLGKVASGADMAPAERGPLTFIPYQALRRHGPPPQARCCSRMPTARGFDEVELFHVINSVREGGTSLLMTSRSWPLSWPVVLPDLRSRLKGPRPMGRDRARRTRHLLSQLITKLFADRQLNIDDKIVGYIVQRMERSFASAQEIVERVDRLALSRRSRISRSLVSDVLNELYEADDHE